MKGDPPTPVTLRAPPGEGEREARRAGRPWPRLVLFPGQGVDGRLFLPQWSGGLPAHIEAVAFPPARPGESLAQFAARAAAPLVAGLTREEGRERRRAPLPSSPSAGGRLYLGGVSLGAMVALEVARALTTAHALPPSLRPAAVFSIAGCRSGRQVAAWLRPVMAVIAHTPVAVLRRSFSFASLGLRLIGRADRRARRLLLALLADGDAALTRWGCGAIPAWDFAGSPGVPLYRVHGELDRVIPLENVRADLSAADLVVPGAGHVLNVTHAAVLNGYLAERIRACEATGQGHAPA